MLAPWTARNYRVYHQIIPTTMIGAYNLWVGNTLLSTGGQIGGGYNPATEYAETYGYLGFHTAANQAFFFFFQEHPARFVALVSLRALRYFSLIRPLGFWFYQHGLGQIIFVICSGFAIVTLFVTGFSGMILAAKERRGLLRYLVALGLTAPLALLPAVVESRYRFQIYPFLALFGSYMLVRWWQERQAMRPLLLKVGAVLLVVSLIDTVIFWPVIVERLGSFFGKII
jgi:hypothetical protein